MPIRSIIDARIPQPTATNQVLVWNNTTGLFEPSVSLSGLTLNSPIISGPLDAQGKILANGGFIGDTDDDELIGIDGAGRIVTVDGELQALNLMMDDTYDVPDTTDRFTGWFISRPTGSDTEFQAATNNIIGVLGGVFGTFDVVSGAGAAQYNKYIIQGLEYSIRNNGNVEFDDDPESSRYIFTGCKLRSILGASGKTVAGAVTPGQIWNAGLTVSAEIEGDVNVTNDVPLYGIQSTTLASAMTGSSQIDSYNLYQTSADEADLNGGLSYHIYQANAGRNQLFGPTNIGDGGSNTAEIDGTGNQKFNGTARFQLPNVTDAGPMTATNGTESEVVYNLSDNKAYVCTVTGTPATWSALN